MINDNKIRIPWYRRNVPQINDLQPIEIPQFELPERPNTRPRPRPRTRLQEEPIRQPVQVPVPNPVTSPVVNPVFDPAFDPRVFPKTLPDLSPFPKPKSEENPYRKPIPKLNPAINPSPSYVVKPENNPIWIDSIIKKIGESEVVVDSEYLANYLMNYNYDTFKVPKMIEELTSEVGIVVAYIVTGAVLSSLITRNVITAPARMFMITPIDPNDINNENGT